VYCTRAESKVFFGRGALLTENLLFVAASTDNEACKLSRSLFQHITTAQYVKIFEIASRRSSYSLLNSHPLPAVKRAVIVLETLSDFFRFSSLK
jgi:hypothetical protein